MPQSDIGTWLNFALQQVAGESYLDGPGTLEERLEQGNNRVGFPGSGFTRMATLQAQQFVQRYEIRDHHADDATGFSATVLRYVEDGVTKYTLSMRSTEFKEQKEPFS